MDEEFRIPVLYNAREMSFPARLLTYAYSYKIEVEVEGARVQFEPDEERNWRALIADEQTLISNNISRELLLAIAASIEEIVK